MALYYPDTLRSNNPKAYGIVRAQEVSGHCTVADLEALCALPDAILSASGDNTGNDAIGKLVWVVSEGEHYMLTSWENRNSADGWTVQTASGNDDIDVITTTAIASLCDDMLK